MNMTFKKKKPLFYVSLGMYALLSVFIIFESCLDSGLSGLQSQVFAKISSWFINEVSDEVPAKLIKPESLELIEDTSYLGTGNIGIGTTTRVTLKATYPKDIDKSKERYDYTYTTNQALGNNNDYNIVWQTSTSANTFNIVMRIVANDISPDLYQIDVNLADTKSYSYQFHIVDLPAPTNYECRLTNTNIKIGGTTTVDIKLKDDNLNKIPEEKDSYLRRYFDTAKLNYSSLDASVATIDRYGVIKGISNGTTKVTYGTYTFDVTVSNETIIKPATNEITLAKSENGKSQLSLLDYDYIATSEDDPNDYSVILYPTFTNNALEDQSVRWESSNPLMGKIAPYSYDLNGYPLYKDEDNKTCVRICGYRQPGDFFIRCISNADNSVYKDINLYSGEAKATNMDVKLSKTGEIAVNDQITVTATIAPKNTNNKCIRVTPSDDKMCDVINNTTEVVTIKALKSGTCHFQVESISNDHLTYEFDMTFTAQKAINEENFSSFHAFMRKFAGHFFLFLVTAIFGMMFFYLFIEDIKKVWLSLSMTLISGFFLAGLSEFIQYFIPTRGGTWSDIGIDFLGYVIGTALTIGVIFLIRLIIMKVKEKKESKPK